MELFAPHCLDSYKISHRQQYSPGTELVFSNFTARSDTYLNIPPLYKDGKIVWFGLQGTLRELVSLWSETFFSKPKEEVLAKYAKRVAAFSSDDRPVHTQHLADLHDLGYLPIRIKSIQEGSLVNIGIPLMTIVNTDPNFFWLTNSLETHLSNESWKSPTVATLARAYRRILDDYADLTGAPKDFVPWQGHCFADRGMSGMVDAAKSGSAHLTSFLGSDSVSAFDYLDQYYSGADTFLGGSVPATEHSVMTLDGQGKEFETIKRIIGEVHDTGVVSFVADSWDFWKVVTEFMPALKETIMGRKFNSIGLSKVVVRPDSGDPVDIICGADIPDLSGIVKDSEELRRVAREFFTSEELARVVGGDVENSQIIEKFIYLGEPFEIEIDLFWNSNDVYNPTLKYSRVTSCEPTTLSPEEKGAIQCLYETFGGTMTNKGYKVLCDRVGLIYGDSITPARAEEICKRLMKKGFASCNIVDGVGSFSYNFNTRDTLGFAMKATYGEVNGVGHEMVKNPKTDSGTKRSAKGLPKVIKKERDYILQQQSSWEEEAEGELKLVFENGNFYNETTIAEIRERILAG